MKRHVLGAIAAGAVYYLWLHFEHRLLVFPSVLELSAFLPPLLGLAIGPAAAFGTALGRLLHDLTLTGMPNLPLVAASFMAAYLPYKLWYNVALDLNKTAFAFSRTILRKFILVIFLTIVCTTLARGMNATNGEILSIFHASGLAVTSLGSYMGIIFLNDFTTGIFFGLPLFFILISYNFRFYVPPDVPIAASRWRAYTVNRLALVLLYIFFLGLFGVLDVSGIIYDLDKTNVWLRFVAEIFVAMDLTLLVLVYLLTKYRHSVMTNLMLMEMVTMVMAAFLLGTVSFMALSRAIDDKVEGELDKMSIIYRERLERVFYGTESTVRNMTKLAAAEVTDYERLRADAAYRREFLRQVGDECRILAEGSPGSVAFYLELAEELTAEGVSARRTADSWGKRLPEFPALTYFTGSKQEENRHVQEQYLAELSAPHRDKDTGRYVISFVMPIQKDNRFVGSVGMDISFDYLVHEMQLLAAYEHGFVYLLGENEEVLYAGSPERELRPGSWGFYETKSYLSTGLWLKIAAYAHDIYSDRNTMLIHFVVMMLFIVIAVSFFCVWLAKKGLRPLLIITEAARKIAAGDLDVRLPHESKNELGILVESIREMVTKLEAYVYRDKLTGLRNTAAYARKTEELAQKVKQDKGAEYAVVVFDANFLKRTNDTYGHDAGNELIRRVSRAICKVFAHSPVFRIGGDEFVTILEGHDYDNREVLLLDFDEEIKEASFTLDGKTVLVSVARGLGLYQNGKEYGEVFQAADEAMYHHKTAIKAKLGIVGR